MPMVLNFILRRTKANLQDGEAAWYGMQPYFWEMGFLNRVQIKEC